MSTTDEPAPDASTGEASRTSTPTEESAPGARDDRALAAADDAGEAAAEASSDEALADEAGSDERRPRMRPRRRRSARRSAPRRPRPARLRRLRRRGRSPSRATSRASRAWTRAIGRAPCATRRSSPRRAISCSRTPTAYRSRSSASSTRSAIPAALRSRSRAGDRDRPGLPRLHGVDERDQAPRRDPHRRDPRRDHRGRQAAPRALPPPARADEGRHQRLPARRPRARSGRRCSSAGSRRGRYRRMLTETRRTAAQLSAPPPALAAPSGPPWLTCAIIGVLALVFVAELVVGRAQGPSFSLRRLTPSSPSAARATRWSWGRGVVAPLHGHAPPRRAASPDPQRVGLFLGGVVLEDLLGRAWLGALFVLGALGGSIASVLINDPGTISVGASGRSWACSRRRWWPPTASHRRTAPRSRCRWCRCWCPRSSRSPSSLQRPHRFAAHIGGALTGLLAGLALLRTWPVTDPHPRFRRAAAGISAGRRRGLPDLVCRGEERLCPLRRGLRGRPHPQREAVVAHLQRRRRCPRQVSAGSARAPARGDQGRAGERSALAEKHLRLALAEEAVLRTSFPDRHLEGVLRSYLARLLEQDGRRAEALTVARPACDLAIPELERLCR